MAKPLERQGSRDTEQRKRKAEITGALGGFNKFLLEQNGGRTKERFSLKKIIGEGTYGVVHRGEDKKTGQKIAIKQMDIDPDKTGLPSVALREIAILGELQHVNLVSLLDVIMGTRHLMLIFEFLDMDLREYQNKQIEKYGRLDFASVRYYTYQLFYGLDYVHERRLIHRDLKPQNVLIDIQKDIIKIADFGLARLHTVPLREMTNEVVTLWYRCPELLLGSDVYTTSVDIWSMAVIIIELIENVAPFEPDSEIRGLHLIFQILGTPDASCWKDVENLKFFCSAFPKWEAKSWREIVPHVPKEYFFLVVDLLAKMLVYDPTKRLTCKEAMAHPLFDVPDEKHGGDIRTHCQNLNRNPPVNSLHPSRMPFPSPKFHHDPKPLSRRMQKVINSEKEFRKTRSPEVHEETASEEIIICESMEVDPNETIDLEKCGMDLERISELRLGGSLCESTGSGNISQWDQSMSCEPSCSTSYQPEVLELELKDRQKEIRRPGLSQPEIDQLFKILKNASKGFMKQPKT